MVKPEEIIPASAMPYGGSIVIDPAGSRNWSGSALNLRLQCGFHGLNGAFSAVTALLSVP
jgi:hypothetical protein